MQIEDSKLDNMIKSRIAEIIIEELLISEGYAVELFGYEHTARSFARKMRSDAPLKGWKGLDKIRAMPDFLAWKDENSYLVEVKYRAKGIIRKGELAALAEHWANHVLFVVTSNEPYIRCSRADLLFRTDPDLVAVGDAEDKCCRELYKTFPSISKKNLDIAKKLAKRWFEGK